MSSYRKAVYIATTAVLAICAGISLCGLPSGTAKGLIFTAVVILLLWGGYLFLHKRSLIALAVSLIPAVTLWGFFLDSNSPVFLIISIASLLTMEIIGRFADLPEVRESTDKWVGTLLISEILLFSALAVFCGLL